jgi:hypothetical protein
LLPDIEAIAVAYLMAHPDITAICGDRVYTEIPEGPTYPFVTVLRIAGRPRPRPRWIDQAQLQISAWGNDDDLSREDTRDLCETAVAALHDLPGVTDLGVVTGVEDILGPRSLPDPETSFPRFEAEVLVTAHPRVLPETFVPLGQAGETGEV